MLSDPPAAAHEEPRGAEDGGSRRPPESPSATDAGRVRQVAFSVALGPGFMQAPGGKRLLGFFHFRTQLEYLGERFGVALVPLQAKPRWPWSFVSVRVGPRIRLTDPRGPTDVVLGYDLGLLRTREQRDRICDTGCPAPEDPEHRLGHGLSLALTQRSPRRESPALGVVAEAIVHARDGVVVAHVAFMIAFGIRRGPERRDPRAVTVQLRP